MQFYKLLKLVGIKNFFPTKKINYQEITECITYSTKLKVHIYCSIIQKLRKPWHTNCIYYNFHQQALHGKIFHRIWEEDIYIP